MIVIIDLISITTVILLFLFVIFLLSNRRGPIISQRFLAAFLLANALYIVNFLFPRLVNLLPQETIHFYYLGYAFGFLFGPLLYFYTKTIAFKNSKIRKTFFLHLFPSLIYAGYVLITYTSQPLTVKIDLFNSGSVQQPLFPYSNYFILHFHILIYLGFSLHILYRYSQAIKGVYSSIASLNLSWLNLVLWAFIVMWIIDLFHLISAISIGISSTVSHSFTFFSLSINFIFANLILFKSLQHPEVFIDGEQRSRYESSTLTEAQLEQYSQQLERVMCDRQPFLNPALTINDLSHELNIHPRIISQTINIKLNKNFYDYVNSFRVEKAKSLLQDPQNTKKTILEILYEAGFNSKSVFNQAFKKQTGMTPTQYRLTAYTGP